MFNSVALDVVIGLVFVYLLYSLLGTVLQEIIATNIGLRGKLLRYAVERMLDDSRNDKKDIKKKGIHGYKPDNPILVSEAFYGHPLIKYLASDSWWPLQKIPAYITKETFSKVMVDLLRGTELQAGDAYNTLIAKSLNEGKIAWTKDCYVCQETLSYLRSLWIDAQGDIVKFKILLEQWFEEMMERTSGWYKKWTQIILLIVGLGLAIVFNIDTIKIVEKLEHNPKLREQVVNQANEYAKAHPQLAVPPTSTTLQDTLYKQATEAVKGDGDITKVNEILALGWQGYFLSNKNNANMDGTTGLGWLLTALAISLGAPFWFDLLNKLMKLRSSVSPSKDKQTVKSGTVPATERVG